MLKEIYTAAVGMMPQQTRLEVIANNMANADTVGFKRSTVFERNLLAATDNFYNVPGDVEQEDPPVGSYLDFSNGAFEYTGGDLDLAIDNDNSFFVVQDADGMDYLTRAGKFRLSKDGSIVTMDGQYLMGTNGILNFQQDIMMDLFREGESQAVDIKISETGEVFANDKEIGQLLIARVNNPQTIENISAQRFITTTETDMEFLPQEEVLVRQGWLENSNVDIISEMVTMIELNRMFEAGSKVIQTNDDTLTKSIGLGKYY